MKHNRNIDHMGASRSAHFQFLLHRPLGATADAFRCMLPSI